MKHFEGKIFWVTGASSGIGEALVYLLTSMGCRVIASSNQPERLKQVMTDCGEGCDKVILAPFDLEDTAAIPSVVKEVIGKTGNIDYLINLGGVSQRATIEETPLWLDRRIMDINYFGTIALTKALLPYMIANGSGHVLGTSSIAGRFGFPLRSAYSASKQAIHGFFETLHIENRSNNIRASVIIPGRVSTNISMSALTGSGSEYGKMDQGLARGIPPEKAARIILRGIKRNRREILVGGGEMTMLYIRRWFPRFFFYLAGKIKPQ